MGPLFTFVPGFTIIETHTAQKKTKSCLAEYCGFEHFFCGYMIVLIDTYDAIKNKGHYIFKCRDLILVGTPYQKF